MSERASLSGLWEGVYAYSSGDLGEFEFKLRLSEKDGKLKGMTLEPGADHGGERKGEVVGSIEERELEFVKTYMVDGQPFARPISYAGMVSADGNTVDGTWKLPDDSGTFRMVRQTV